jgi:hypothetical protein
MVVDDQYGRAHGLIVTHLASRAQGARPGIASGFSLSSAGPKTEAPSEPSPRIAPLDDRLRLRSVGDDITDAVVDVDARLERAAAQLSSL